MSEPQPSPHDLETQAPGPDVRWANYGAGSINELQMQDGGGRRARALIVTLVAVGVAVLAATGWRLMGSTPSGSTPAASATAGGPPSRVEAALQTIALQQNELRGGYRLQLAVHGDQVAGQQTLDNCGYRFTTEAHRIARRQYVVVDAAGHFAGFGNEVVAYDTKSNAALALKQWHRAALTCPHHPVPADVPGGGHALERVTRDDLAVAALPVRHNVVTVESITARRLGTIHATAVLQVHGNILDAVYATGRRAPTAHELHRLMVIATATGRRLAHGS